MAETASPAPVAIVVNDDAVQRNFQARLLAREGLEVRGYEGAEAALAAMDPSQPPSIIVTDLYMPGIDGWRFCRLLRSPEFPAFNQVPLLVVSATYSGDEPDRIASELGAAGFVPSPVDPHRFTEQVLAVLQGRKSTVLPRVLIVEDSRTLAGMLKRVFQANGYEAAVAGSVMEATQAFERTAFDVAVLDYHLPDGLGDTLLDLFQAQRPGCVCVMMTTDPGPALAMEWMKRGAADYLRKPFEEQYLIELCARARRERALLRAQDLLEVRTQELRKSEDFARRVLDSTDAHLAVVGEGGIILDVNEAWVRFARANGAGAIDGWGPGANYFQCCCTPQGGAPSSKEAFEGIRGVQDGTLESFEMEYTCHSPQERRWFTMRVLPFQGRPGTVLVSHIDITTLKLAEDRLTQSEARVRALLAAIPDLMFTFDHDGTFLDYHAPQAQLLAQPPEVFLGQNIRHLLPPEVANLTLAHIDDIRRHGVTAPFTYTLPFDGMTRHFETRMVPATGDQALAIVRDITEARQAEANRASLQAQLLQAQKMESVGRLAGGVAHDFNNMLCVILGLSDLLLMQVEPGHKAYGPLQEIQKAANRSAKLTSQLLAFARRQTIAPRVLDLNGTVEDMLKMLQRLIGENITLTWIPGADLWSVRVDPTQIDQALANLCVNARDAIDGVGTITIETRNARLGDAFCAERPGLCPGDYVQLRVTDDGRGMDEATRKMVFEPFFTTKEVGKGTGLGLTTIYGIVKQNRGWIQVLSEPGKGTTFNLYLPRDFAQPEPARTEATLRPHHGGDRTILVVEDEPAILDVAANLLRQSGYTVLTAAAPGEAIRIAESMPGVIDLLLSDVVLPEMNGRDLARALQASHPEMRQLYMSGYAAGVSEDRAVLEEGAPFIQKPFTLKELGDRVREAMDGA